MARKGGLNALEIPAGVLFWAVFFFEFVVLVDGNELRRATNGGGGVVGVVGN
jgi:hypothetical protein